MIRDEEEIVRPVSMVHPCIECNKTYEWYQEFGDIEKVKTLAEECRNTCDDSLYFKKFKINRRVEPITDELDVLVFWLTELLVKRDSGSGLDEEERDRMRVWGDRLSLVVAIEEARIAVARSFLDQM